MRKYSNVLGAFNGLHTGITEGSFRPDLEDFTPRLKKLLDKVIAEGNYVVVAQRLAHNNKIGDYRDVLTGLSPTHAPAFPAFYRTNGPEDTLILPRRLRDGKLVVNAVFNADCHHCVGQIKGDDTIYVGAHWSLEAVIQEKPIKDSGVTFHPGISLRPGALEELASHLKLRNIDPDALRVHLGNGILEGYVQDVSHERFGIINGVRRLRLVDEFGRQSIIELDDGNYAIHIPNIIKAQAESLGLDPNNFTFDPACSAILTDDDGNPMHFSNAHKNFGLRAEHSTVARNASLWWAE